MSIFKKLIEFFTENQGVDMRVTVSEVATGRFGLLDTCGCLVTDKTYSRRRDAVRGAERLGFRVA